MALQLNPEEALIFRIVHRDNLPWILDHGLHARNSHMPDPNFRAIGNADLIDKRATRPVPVPPGGVLSDYVPFYFTPHSIMMFNIDLRVLAAPPECQWRPVRLYQSACLSMGSGVFRQHGGPEACRLAIAPKPRLSA